MRVPDAERAGEAHGRAASGENPSQRRAGVARRALTAVRPAARRRRVAGGVALYLHPAFGLATVLLAAWAGSLGLRSRQPGVGAAARRARHARLAPWAYGAMLVAWASGLATVRWLRDDLEPATSGHFTAGSAMVALLTAAAILSRRVAIDARARRLHPWLGAAAVLHGGVQFFLGLQIMPH